MKEDGGPAFPRPFSEEPIENSEGAMYPHDAQSGMSLRDWFAGQALSGLIVNPDTVSVYCPLSMRAYEIADAMLAERGKDA